MATKVHNFQSGVIPTSEHTVFDLPVGAYSVRVDQHGNYFLEHATVPADPSKIYGEDTGIRATRYLESFKSSPNKSMGALLIGDPGSGKTMLIRKIINQGIRDGITVILVGQGFHGSNFNKFIHEALRDTSAIVVMDEFEKMFNMADDEVLAPLLTLFDGPSDSHKFFLCSANDRNQIADPFFNRPSRFYYIAEFGSVGDDVIKQYIEENLQFPELAGELIATLIEMDKVNFDCLSTAVREVNRCGNVKMAFMDLNIRDKFSRDGVYAITRVVDAETGVDYSFDPDNYFRPQTDDISFFVTNEPQSITTRNKHPDNEDDNCGEKTRHYGAIDRTIPPTRIDGCFVFSARSSNDGRMVNVFIRSTASLFAF